MFQRKMPQFSTGALLLLLPWFGGLVLGEVSSDFDNCEEFFYLNTPPTGIAGNQYQPICQRYNNSYRFATLYNRQLRSALYSAYILSRPEGARRDIKEIWMYEPQLANPRANPEMQPLPTKDNNVINSQAMLEDYADSLYTRGHLTPTMHQHTLEDRAATFTLTNIVPQRGGSNSGPWRLLEEEVLNMKAYCRGDMYVITGVMPGNRQMNRRVSIPDYLWSAYCCTDYDNNTIPEDLRSKFPTYAAVGSNIEKRSECDPVRVPTNGFAVKQMSLARLEKNLRAKLRMTISLFAGGCRVIN